jgi:cytochrome oxidase assembly protein ShyY1
MHAMIMITIYFYLQTWDVTSMHASCSSVASSSACSHVAGNRSFARSVPRATRAPAWEGDLMLVNLFLLVLLFVLLFVLLLLGCWSIPKTSFACSLPLIAQKIIESFLTLNAKVKAFLS